MAKDTIVEILSSIRNAEVNTKRVVRIAFANLSKSLVKILLHEVFIENVRKH